MRTQIFICGGGTGGHFFCGLALGELFLEKVPTARVHFIGTKKGIEGRFSFEDRRMTFHSICAQGILGKNGLIKILSFFLLALGFLQSIFLLFKYRPKIVCGVGGYASVPTLLTAFFFGKLFRCRTIILEQNYFPGAANRFLSRYCFHAFSAFERQGFETINLPLRKKIREAVKNIRPFEWPPKAIFILGGSQGASGLNEKWCELLPFFKMTFPHVQLIHQTGGADFEKIKKIYEQHQLIATVFPFSDDMSEWYQKADCIISRAGALAIFEVMAFQRPAIFVPFPWATDDHQTMNALAVQEPSWIIDQKLLTLERLSPLLKSSTPSVPQRKYSVAYQWDKFFDFLLASG